MLVASVETPTKYFDKYNKLTAPNHPTLANTDTRFKTQSKEQSKLNHCA
jgi:hypothetical protein